MDRCHRLRLVRGASGGGGASALNELEQKLKSGDSVMLAVDGPAGPGFKVKRGCIDLAQNTGLPIVPVSYTNPQGKIKTSRWDRMIIPGFFNSIEIKYGSPIYLTKELTLEESAQKIEMALNALDPQRS